MYAALWRVLPGPVWLRVVLVLLLVAAVAAVCLFWVFPWIDQLMSTPQGVTVGSSP